MREFRYRFVFSKIGPVCFVSHLDLIRVFQRAIKRSGLPISFSQGFNPHQQTSFAFPLSTGVEGCEELLDAEFESGLDENEAVKRLNQNLPEGIIVTSAMRLSGTEPSAGAKVYGAEYLAVTDLDKELAADLSRVIGEILESKSIVVTKTNKKGKAEAEIREDILTLKAESCDEGIALCMALSSGSQRNLKPELVCEYMYERLGQSFKPHLIRITRRKLLLRDC